MKEEEIAQLIAQMIQNGIIVTGFYKEEGNLESLFMQLTGGQEDEN
jgi:ABC-2 type transport system ATP-binding protein